MLVAGGRSTFFLFLKRAFAVIAQCLIVLEKGSLLHATRVVKGQFAGTSSEYMRGEHEVKG